MAVHAPLFFLFPRLAPRWALACLAPLTLSAELSWRQPIHTETLAPGVESAEVRFAFKNTGTTTVKITELNSGCGCTTARSDPKSFAPEPEGVVTVNFQARGSLALLLGAAGGVCADRAAQGTDATETQELPVTGPIGAVVCAPPAAL
ncbi:MAG: DUF1573 domain-containing protein [Verrucomicrobia bacterium]|nr:DUF1573 domain-containing protein [Verrucomicrobiota bacterium]